MTELFFGFGVARLLFSDGKNNKKAMVALKLKSPKSCVNLPGSNVDPGLTNACLFFRGVFPSRSDESPLKPGTHPY